MGSTTIVRSEPPVSDREETSSPRTRGGPRTAGPLTGESAVSITANIIPSLLRYVVNETLEGRGSHLKERALGVEVFSRDPDYDTNADPVVRTSACEVRKRIAQYYHEPGHEDEIRIDLPAGSYVPEFRFAAIKARPAVVEPDRSEGSHLCFSARAGATETGANCPGGVRVGDGGNRRRWKCAARRRRSRASGVRSGHRRIR